jgi:hypothetical protein
MAGRHDHDGNGHLPAVAIRCAQVDCAHSPPVDGILWIHHMENGGLIHVDGEGGQSIPIVDDGNNSIEVPPGLLGYFLGGGGWAVWVAMQWARPFSAIKQQIDIFYAERVLSLKAGLNLQAFLMRQRQETRIPFPCHLSTKETSSSVNVSMQPAGPGCKLCPSDLTDSSSKTGLECHLKTWESPPCMIAQAWFCWRCSSTIMRSTVAKMSSLSPDE